MKQSSVPSPNYTMSLIGPPPPVQQQTATHQVTIVFYLHLQSFKHFVLIDCCGKFLLIVSFTFKCCLQIEFHTSHHFHKLYSYYFWLPHLPLIPILSSSYFRDCTYFFASKYFIFKFWTLQIFGNSVSSSALISQTTWCGP